jgi:hypothetical protein
MQRTQGILRNAKGKNAGHAMLVPKQYQHHLYLVGAERVLQGGAASQAVQGKVASQTQVAAWHTLCQVKSDLVQYPGT